MPDSQSQSPGDSFAISERARLETLILRAGDLEQQLANLKKSDEQTAAALRSHLCEVLSDIIISDPVLSWENDCAGKLWRSCFYAPIVVWRKKLSREKKRQGSAVKSLEQNFKRFLSEALTLYDYLVVQYQSKILSNTNTARGSVPEHSQLSAASSVEAVDPAKQIDPVEGIIPGLFRLFIHMGDLHRYAENFSKAETYYVYASRLAPGMGNPYNQLAVVSQLKDPNLSCVALYWYCRSLLATHDSFETSSSNLERLFDMNRTYLQEHSRTSSPPIFSQSTKKMSSDMLRAEKAAVTKTCLAHFVDFHYDLFKTSTSALSIHADNLLGSKMDGLVRSLESLLHASAFGDSLLVKMVLINTFSVERAAMSQAFLKLQVAIDFFWHFGRILVERLNAGLVIAVEKAGKQPNTIRVLQPLLIQLEYARQHPSGSPIQRTINVNFLRSLTAAATNMRQLYSVSVIPEVTSESMELSMLKGYKPFAALNSSYCNGSPFVDANDAVFVLDLQQTQSQPSSKQKEENLARVEHFIHVSGSLGLHSDAPTLQCDTSWNHDQESAVAVVDFRTSQGGQEIPAATDAASDSDEGGDLVIDMQPEEQPMVELLRKETPSQIIDSSGVHTAILRNDHEHFCVEESSFNPIRPPPGFEVSTGFRLPGSEQTIACAGSMERPVNPEQVSLPHYHSMGAGRVEYADDAKMIVHDSSSQKQSFHYGEMFIPTELSESFLNGSIPYSNNPFYDRTSQVTSLAPEAQTYAFSAFHDNTPLSNLSWLEGIWEDHSKAKTQNPFAN